MIRQRSLSGAVVLVTGGARGIGRATAEAFASAGARVGIGDLDSEGAQAVADALGGFGAALDVTDRDCYAAWLRAAQQQLGPVDVLVSNAGIMSIGSFSDEAPESVRRQVDINVHGVLTGMQLVLPGMLARRRGHLINLASSAGRIAVPGGATYTGTKWMVLGASEALRGELHGSGIDVSCILPGLVNTELTSGLDRPSYVTELQPGDVAAAIVRTARRPRFEVWVPRSLGRQQRTMALMPRPLREALTRATKADRFLLDHDAGARAAYEARAGANASR